MYVATCVCDYMITLQKVVASASFTSLLALRKQAAIFVYCHMTKNCGKLQGIESGLQPTPSKKMGPFALRLLRIGF